MALLSLLCRFLIARRYWNHWWPHSILFNITWFGIRIVLYPFLLFQYYGVWSDYSEEIGTHINSMTIAPIFQVVLIILNLKWTADLLKSKLIGAKQKGL